MFVSQVVEFKCFGYPLRWNEMTDIPDLLPRELIWQHNLLNAKYV